MPSYCCEKSGLTAFAASDTRYVLYAALHRNGTDPPKEIASGHAILASRTELDDDAKVRKAYGAHGHWIVPVGQLGLFDPTYPDRAPPLLKEELDKLEDTGTVVCITGFNDFRDKEEDAVKAIARVAAKNYLVAIWRDEMVLYIGEETVTPVRELIVERSSLHDVLYPHRNQRRTRSGWLPGEQAYRSLRTLQEGEWLDLSCGAKARARLLDAKEGVSSRVQLFRDGMWITNQADALVASSFTGFKPFDAAIMIGRGGLAEEGELTEIERLVRSAEGPEHRGLDRRRLGSWEEKTPIEPVAGDPRRTPRVWAGKIEEVEEDTPDDFAVFVGTGVRSVAPEPRYRPREPRIPEEDDDGDKPSGKSAQPSDEEEEPIDPRGRKRKRKPIRRGARPKPGNSIPGRMATVAQPSQNGGVRVLRVSWRASQKHLRTTRASRLGIRVRIPSGSDTTCDLPLGPRWLKLMELRPKEGEPTPIYDNGYEATLPLGNELEFTVTLKKPITDPRAVEAIEVDIVGRAQPARARLPEDEEADS